MLMYECSIWLMKITIDSLTITLTYEVCFLIAQLGRAGVQQAEPREQLPIVAPAHGTRRGGGRQCGWSHGHTAHQRRWGPRPPLGGARPRCSRTSWGRGWGQGRGRGGKHSAREAGRRAARLHGTRAARAPGSHRQPLRRGARTRALL